MNIIQLLHRLFRSLEPERFMHRLLGSRDKQIDEEIDLVWDALEAIRNETERVQGVQWVKLSSWTSTEGDIGGVMIGDEEDNIQLFISRDRGPNEQGEMAGYSINIFRSGSGIDEHWDTGESTDKSRNVSDTVHKFEAYLRGLLAAGNDSRDHRGRE
jgi:hypothetical protein